MMTEPKLEERGEQPYMGIRTLAAIRELSKVIPKLHKEVLAWLKKQGIAPSGPPFTRYHVIDMANKMDIELGVPVANTLQGNDRVKPGVLPAGRYASLVYTGVRNGMKGNAALLDWGSEQGLKWDRWDEETGDAFRGRYESFLTDPADEPDLEKWETEVAIMILE